MFDRVLAKVFKEPWALDETTFALVQEAVLDRIEKGPSSTRGENLFVTPYSETAFEAGLSAPRDPGSRVWTAGQLAVIPVRGIIGSHLSNMEKMCGGYGLEQLTNDLHRAQAETSIRRVLVDFHSPGGTLTQLPETGRLLAELGREKETFGFSSGGSYSASYWLMSQANTVYLTESAGIGNVGVYRAWIDRTKAMEMRGEKVELIRSGRFKGSGLPGIPISDEERGMMKARVEKLHTQFKDVVRSKRGKIAEDDLEGQIYYGQEAVEKGFANSTVRSLRNLVKHLS